jgi:hypothetical protein
MLMQIYSYIVSKLKSNNESMIKKFKTPIMAMEIKLSKNQSALLSYSIKAPCSTMIQWILVFLLAKDSSTKIVLCSIQIQMVIKIMLSSYYFLK